jgi:hypothetical protein
VWPECSLIAASKVSCKGFLERGGKVDESAKVRMSHFLPVFYTRREISKEDEGANFRTDALSSHYTRSEVEGVALPGPDLPYLVSDTQFHRPIQAVDLGADPQTAVLEGDLDQQPSEAHG